jgi:two-component system LytT family sensor kinase
LKKAYKQSHIQDKNLKIKINFKVHNGSRLHFEIINNFVPSQNPKFKKGIGILNTKKRLELIFEGNYTFEQKIKLNCYIIRLQIPLNNED